MTDAQAKSIISTWYQTTLAGNDDTYTGFTENEWMSLEQAITVALDTREREMWEKAAQYATECEAVETERSFILAWHKIAAWCRRQGGGG